MVASGSRKFTSLLSRSDGDVFSYKFHLFLFADFIYRRTNKKKSFLFILNPSCKDEWRPPEVDLLNRSDSFLLNTVRSLLKLVHRNTSHLAFKSCQ